MNMILGSYIKKLLSATCIPRILPHIFPVKFFVCLIVHYLVFLKWNYKLLFIESHLEMSVFCLFYQIVMILLTFEHNPLYSKIIAQFFASSLCLSTAYVKFLITNKNLLREVNIKADSNIRAYVILYVYDYIYIVNMKDERVKHRHERMNTRAEVTGYTLMDFRNIAV